ncbi:phosphoglucomutase/phosphomannomutase family protein [Lacrimispora indolis]|uniref:phosphoglucomutase/phosphomannomutase family protein n=1 Tax=Lacrimispora indolis TaxID=69825 RepID=UPI00045E7FBD|nr:phosphoglucomutase/phosphomannomutase family protein [Lacrimispora indolis]
MVTFGTGGWRAIIGEDFTKENIQKLALAVSLKMKTEKKEEEGIVIGYDRRFLSKEAVIWACEIFGSQGIRVFFINRSSPTPLIMFYVMKHRLSYGMMVTASHNPAIYNGIKVFTYGGRDADETQTRDIETYLSEAEKIYRPNRQEAGQMPPASYLQLVKKGVVEEINPLNEYLDNIISVIDMEAIRSRDFRVAIDPMYGVSLTALSTILSVARCTIETINDQHDTLFGGKMPAPTEQTLRSLQNYVLDRYCDIGIATDGDADRLGVIDDQGRYLHANNILVMLYYYLLKYKGWRGPVVRSLSTTHVLDRVAESFGQTCYEVPVGFKFVSAKMQETDAIIGGESSGGLTVKGHIHGKDGIYAASLLIEMMAVSGKKLSEIAADIRREYGAIHMTERDYRFTAEEKERISRILMIDRELPLLPFEIDKISYMDGCKIYFKNGGWVIARFSGTEPLLRIFCEMEAEADSVSVCSLFEEYLGLQAG